MTTQGLAHADIGRLGIWSPELRGADPSAAGDAAAELDEAGWGALWLAGAGGPGIWRSASHLLAATTRLSVALGVASIWGPDADIAAVEFSRITGQHGRRLLAGFGVSTPQNASAVGKPFGTPLDAMNNYWTTSTTPQRHCRPTIASSEPWARAWSNSRAGAPQASTRSWSLRSRTSPTEASSARVP